MINTLHNIIDSRTKSVSREISRKNATISIYDVTSTEIWISTTRGWETSSNQGNPGYNIFTSRV